MMMNVFFFGNGVYGVSGLFYIVICVESIMGKGWFFVFVEYGSVM